MRQMVRLTLKQSGFDVLEAENGQAALDLLGSTQVDLIICDVNMPILNGIETTRKLRSMPNYKRTPIVLLTTESDSSKKMAGRQAGATGWIVKPFQPTQLQKVVQRVLPN
jgi:two-component system chemotaxis response regulator CheY